MSAYRQHHQPRLVSTEKDRARIVEVLQEFGPLDVETMRNRATFASATRFRSAVEDLWRAKHIDMIAGGRGYRVHGDERRVNFDENCNARIKRRQRYQRIVDLQGLAGAAR